MEKIQYVAMAELCLDAPVAALLCRKDSQVGYVVVQNLRFYSRKLSNEHEPKNFAGSDERVTPMVFLCLAPSNTRDIRSQLGTDSTLPQTQTVTSRRPVAQPAAKRRVLGDVGNCTITSIGSKSAPIAEKHGSAVTCSSAIR